MTIEAAPAIVYREPEPTGPTAPFIPQPATIAETGLELTLLVDLLLKTIHFAGRPTGRQLSEQLALSFSVTEELIAFLRQEQALELVGMGGVGEQSYQYTLTERGRQNAAEALARNQYVGPAPVTFSVYKEVLKQQSVSEVFIDRETFERSLGHLILPASVIMALGPAISSGRSLLIYGASGNGKTSVTMAIGGMMPGEVLIPYAVEIHGQIVKVFDPRVHERLSEDIDPDHRRDGQAASPIKERRRDLRWALAKRPTVSVGGELTLQDLELRYSGVSHFYIAPLQWKANSGVLIIDDFGRQMIQPQELLNRWIVPMEQGVDHLSLSTGDTIELPFETLLIFSSNIPPGRLGDEAFFRRIRHKVEIPNPTAEAFLEILKQVCQERGIAYDPAGANHLLTTHYQLLGREPKGCHPRDIVDLLVDIARFHCEEPTLTPRWIDMACKSYFVETETAA